MQAHATDLRAEVADRPDADEFVRALVRDWRSVGLDAKTVALLDYAERVTATPRACLESDIDRLRDAGWDDTAIHDTVQVIAYFNYINRVADALGVELDEGMPEWGEPTG